MRLLQMSIVAAGVVVVYLVTYTTRDILLRTRSFLYQAACILLVAALPVAGFLLYLLIRPSRTLKEREMETLLKDLLEHQTTERGHLSESDPAKEPAEHLEVSSSYES